MAVEVGSAYVSIVPSFRNFGSSLHAGIGNEGAKIGETVANQIGQGVTKAAPGTVHSSVRNSIKGAGDAGAAEGRSAASRISGSLIGGLKGLGPSLVATAGLGAISVAGEKSVETYEALTKAALKSSRELGTSVTEASRLNFAFRQSGLDVDAASGSLKKFSTFLTSNKDASKTLGFAVKDATGQVKPMGQVLLQTADMFSKMPNGAEKTATAVKLFGRAGLGMLPFLNKGAEGIQALMDKSDKLGLTISGEDANDIKNHIAAQRNWQAASEGLQFQIGKALMPVLTFLATWLSSTGVPAIAKVTSVLREIGEAVLPIVMRAFDFLGKLVAPIIGAIVSGVGSMVEAFKRGGSEVEGSGLSAFFQRIGLVGRQVFDAVKGGIQAMVAAFKAGGNDVTSSGFAGFMERLGLLARQLFDWLKSTGIPALESFAQWIGPILGQALQYVWPILEGVGAVLTSTLDFIRNNQTVVLSLAGAVGVAVAAWKVYQAAQWVATGGLKAWFLATKVVTVATKAWAAVQAAFNAVMDANPIALVVIAIAALVAGLIIAYNHSATFRAIVQGALHAVADAGLWMWNSVLKPTWDALVAAWNSVASFFQTVWNSVLKPVFDVIGIVVGVWWTVVKTYFTLVWDLVKLVFEGIVLVWNTVLKPVFDVIAAIVTWLAETVFQVALGIIKLEWAGLVAIFSLLWNTVLKPVFNAVAAIAVWLWQNVLLPAFAGIKALWNDLLLGMKVIWDNVLHPAFNAIAAVANWLWQNVAIPVFAGIHAAWNVLVNGIKSLWDNVLHPVFTTVVSIIQTAARDVGSAWDGLKTAFGSAFEGAKKAVVDGWNSIADWVDKNVIGKINATFAIHIPDLPHFAGGGPVRGPGTGTSDSIMARLSNGEFVMTAAAVKAIGVDTLNKLNQAHRIRYTSGDASGLSFTAPGFAGGGLVDSTKTWIQQQAGKPYVMNATGPGAWDCSGLVGAVWALLSGKNPYQRHFSTVDEGRFFKPGLGGPHAFNVGYYGGGGASGHTVGVLDGLHFEATPPHALVGRTNYTPESSLFTGHGHLDVGGSGTVWGWLYDHTIGEVKGALTGAMSGIANAIPDMGMLDDVLRGVTSKAVGLLSFDNGGQLPQGRWLVDHNSPVPDKVLTDSQWTVAARAIEQATGGRPPIVVNVYPSAEHSETEVAAQVQRELAWNLR